MTRKPGGFGLSGDGAPASRDNARPRPMTRIGYYGRAGDVVLARGSGAQDATPGGLGIYGPGFLRLCLPLQV
ncbi:hypothetical protein ACOZ4Y_07850 [Komagataeibacter rhaeticus]|uniref:hypothetical protein n=1 Tax=Komagataeibacter rhaeticus TaxID=215221 RepID=UPI0005511FBE|nr:hypothetical protein [Komagataeibacter rhaeticus]MBL7239743.1 hypothetical protein [Komagataeibacter rhaeticus]GBQ11428.1 hypothetical protein AA16663_0853 [Komagataeibacter rhaeticus DSM 16663]